MTSSCAQRRRTSRHHRSAITRRRDGETAASAGAGGGQHDGPAQPMHRRAGGRHPRRDRFSHLPFGGAVAVTVHPTARSAAGTWYARFAGRRVRRFLLCPNVDPVALRTRPKSRLAARCPPAAEPCRRPDREPASWLWLAGRGPLPRVSVPRCGGHRRCPVPNRWRCGRWATADQSCARPGVALQLGDSPGRPAVAVGAYTYANLSGRNPNLRYSGQ